MKTRAVLALLIAAGLQATPATTRKTDTAHAAVKATVEADLRERLTTETAAHARVLASLGAVKAQLAASLGQQERQAQRDNEIAHIQHYPLLFALIPTLPAIFGLVIAIVNRRTLRHAKADQRRELGEIKVLVNGNLHQAQADVAFLTAEVKVLQSALASMTRFPAPPSRPE